MSRTKREDFTDLQKAQIFARDKGICAFSGKSLRVLDYGVSPTMDIDRVDHIKPASKNGKNTLDNGICASSLFNSKKRNNTADNVYFFKNGLPTDEFYYFFVKISKEQTDKIKKFEKIDYSDWFFNRALSRFCRGVGYLYAKEVENKIHKRDDEYYAKSTIVAFEKWKKEKSRSGVSSLKERGLVSDNLSIDQQMMYDLQDKTDIDEILSVMHKLYPYYREGVNFIDKFSEITQKSDAKIFKTELLRNDFLTELDKANLLHNLEVLWNV